MSCGRPQRQQAVVAESSSFHDNAERLLRFESITKHYETRRLSFGLRPVDCGGFRHLTKGFSERVAEEPIVYVVDDEDDVRQSIEHLVESMGIFVKSYDRAEDFLKDVTDEPVGCLVTDVRMLGMGGVALVNEIKKRNWILPIIVVTAHADVRMALDLVQMGAMTLLEKPYRQQELWESITKALEAGCSQTLERQLHQSVRERLTKLTTIEMRILDEIIQGTPNKNISSKFHLARRTLELRRQTLMKTMECQSVIDLLRLLANAGFSLDKPIRDQLR